jgi:cell division ATPase FtsA
MELVDKSGLLEENIFGRPGLDTSTLIGVAESDDHHLDTMFRIGAVTIGGVRDILVQPKFRVGIGADVTFYHVPGDLESIYGSNPTSFHVFVRIRPGKMQH